MYEFEILSPEMFILVRGTAERFIEEQSFVKWIEPSAKAVKNAAYLKYRATNWRANSFFVKVI